MATIISALGKLEKAEAFYRQSLATYPNYYRALAGMAQVRAAQKRYDEAIDLYRKAIAILPMPEYIAALGDVYSKIGKSDEARKQYELVEYIGKLNALNKALYNRELAYFYADHDIKPKEGLELAQRELDYRRDIYAYDVLAWNLYKNGKAEEAREAINKALSLGTKDAKLFYHAGMIYHRLGDKPKAQKYLRLALDTNPYFHIFFADQAAHTLKSLGGSEESARYIGKPTGGSPMRPRLIASLFFVFLLAAVGEVAAHPLGNFSISQYSAIRINGNEIEIRYIIDMAEIPTFQEIQETGIVPQAGDSSLDTYLKRKTDMLGRGLILEINGLRLTPLPESREIIFPPGAGGLPTYEDRHPV